jgi:catechol 1,2-dioxygenase
MTSPDALRDERLDSLLSVLGQVQGDDPRFGELISSLVRQLHADEFILLSDVLGPTTAVDDANFAGDANATPSSVERPFHSPAPPRADGDRVSAGPERDGAEVMVVRGQVTDTDGKPIAGATVDIWQADDGADCFSSVVPSGYPVPTDGPGGELGDAVEVEIDRLGVLRTPITGPGDRP